MQRWLGWRAHAAAALACVGLLAGATPALAQDDPPGRVGRLAAIQGEVFVYDDELGEWQAAQHNRPLTQGDRLSTAADGRVELRIGSTTLHLGGSAELDAMRLDDDRLRFALLRGSLALRVRSNEVAAELEVLSPEGRFMPLRSGLYRIDRQDEISSAGVWRGELAFHAPDLSRTLQPGQRAEFWRDGPQRIARSQWLAPLDDAFAQAVLREDQADTRSAATVFVSPEMTGVEDLDRHGGWQQHPEYGAVWTPSSVVVGWAPYRHGQWVWLRPWGWTWVDDAPWGFAPFHYGRWVSWGGRWSWAPGPRVARPVYAPALVAWAGGPQFNVQVGSRPVPAVGWVPLAPREHYRPGYRASPGYLNRLNAHPQLLGPPGPGYGNRHVPGAVTVLPAQQLVPRQPVAAAALRADEMVQARRWQAERFHFDAPGRPAHVPRESARPLAAVPVGPTSGIVGVAPGGATAMPGRATGSGPVSSPGGALGLPAVPGGKPVPWPSAADRPARAAPAQPNAQAQGDVAARPPVAVQAPQPMQPMGAQQPMQTQQPMRPVQPAPMSLPGATAPAALPVRPSQPSQPVQPVQQSAQSTGPFGGRPSHPAAPTPGQAPAQAARAAVPVAPPAVGGGQAAAAPPPVMAAPPKPAQPTAVALPTPPVAAAPKALAAPAVPAAPGTAAAPPMRTAPPNAVARDDDPGARRRTPDSRQQQREK